MAYSPCDKCGKFKLFGMYLKTADGLIVRCDDCVLLHGEPTGEHGMAYRPKRDATPKTACVICGVWTKRATVATLLKGEAMCWDCADRQHHKSAGKIQKTTAPIRPIKQQHR